MNASCLGTKRAISRTFAAELTILGAAGLQRRLMLLARCHMPPLMLWFITRLRFNVDNFMELNHAVNLLGAVWNRKCIQSLRLGFCDERTFSDTDSVSRPQRGCRKATSSLIIGEVSMQFIKGNAVKSGAYVASCILNCVCPECGGRMGERGKEFKCQGECLRDWRQIWEAMLSSGH